MNRTQIHMGEECWRLEDMDGLVAFVSCRGRAGAKIFGAKHLGLRPTIGAVPWPLADVPAGYSVHKSFFEAA